MVRVRVASKTVWSPCYTRAISERFRDQHYKALYKLTFCTSLFPNNMKHVSQECIQCLPRTLRKPIQAFAINSIFQELSRQSFRQTFRTSGDPWKLFVTLLHTVWRVLWHETCSISFHFY